jgi:hypothetical protein
MRDPRAAEVKEWNVTRQGQVDDNWPPMGSISEMWANTKPRFRDRLAGDRQKSPSTSDSGAFGCQFLPPNQFRLRRRFPAELIPPEEDQPDGTC